MVDFSYQSYATYEATFDFDSGTFAFVLQSQTFTPGTLVDEDDDNQFENGDSISAPVSADYGGIKNVGGTIYPGFAATPLAYIFFDDATVAPATLPIGFDVVVYPFCFGEGTAIATPTGPRSVEDLAIGDTITTSDGASCAVRWIGRQTVSTRFGPAKRLMPVRVRAGALGDGLPLRDLTLTADHALLIDGLLINAGALVNGESIAYVPLAELGDSYTVYHIETEDHDVILAEGTPAETYIDYAARRSFDNYAEYVALYGEDRTIREMDYPRISSARLVPSPIKAILARHKAA